MKFYILFPQDDTEYNSIYSCFENAHEQFQINQEELPGIWYIMEVEEGEEFYGAIGQDAIFFDRSSYNSNKIVLSTEIIAARKIQNFYRRKIKKPIVPKKSVFNFFNR